MPKLTKSVVDALTPPAVGQKYCWDSELKGFSVRVLPTGLKVFMLQYRNSEGVSKRLKIGRYGVLTPDEARTQAKVYLARNRSSGGSGRCKGRADDWENL